MSPRAYRASKIAAEILVPVAMVAAWQAWAVMNDDPKFPKPTTILVEFRHLWLFSQFGEHVVPSLERIGLGFAIAVLIGVAIGIPLGLSELAHKAAMPHIEYWRAIPPPALLPISLVLTHSIQNPQKVSFIAFFCLFPVLLNTIDGVRGIEPALVDTARSYRIPWHERIRRIVLPAALPQIVAGMRNSLSLAVIMMVLSEYFASTSGIGYVLLNSKNTFQFLPMWAAILLIGVLGYLLNLLFLAFERRALAWHRGWRGLEAGGGGRAEPLEQAPVGAAA